MVKSLWKYRYHISSAALTKVRFAGAVRSHWAVENSPHRVFNVCMKEDECQIYHGNADAFGIGMLNAFGALALVYAFRYGRAIISGSMVYFLSPIITSVISLILLRVLPGSFATIGSFLALLSTLLLTLGELETNHIAQRKKFHFAIF